MESNLIKQATSQITVNQPEQSALSKELKNKLTKDEAEIVATANKSPALGRYGDVEILTAVELLIFKIHVITGWKLPDNSAYEAVLIDQLVKKIREDYYMLNKEEIEYAFRKHAVKDWGKSFNLQLFDEVLIPFLNQKTEIKNFVERLPQKENLLPGVSDWKIVCEECYQTFLTGKYNVELWPYQMYDEFVRAGMMQEDVYEEWIRNSYYTIISKPVENNKDKERIYSIREKPKEHPEVIALAKRLAVELLFKTAKSKNIKNLFYEKG